MSASLPVTEVEVSAPILDSAGAVSGARQGRVRVCSEPLSPGLALALVQAPEGAFQMGSRPGLGYDDERPQRRVQVRAFWMGRSPVTQAQWRVVMGRARGRFEGEDRPVETVDWRSAKEFCKRLSARTGRDYRLPSEAQWEYACRAGSAAPFACGDTLTTDLANFNGDFSYSAGPRGVYRHTTTASGLFSPNAFGLFDMHGNVWEWCEDMWHADYAGAPADDRPWTHDGLAPYRAARGGSWHDTPDVCRSAARLMLPETEGDEFTGFRVVMMSPG